MTTYVTGCEFLHSVEEKKAEFLNYSDSSSYPSVIGPARVGVVPPRRSYSSLISASVSSSYPAGVTPAASLRCHSSSAPKYLFIRWYLSCLHCNEWL